MPKNLPKEGPHNRLPQDVAPPVKRLTASEMRKKAKIKEEQMQERISRLTAGELSPDLDFYLQTIDFGDTIKARRLA